MQSMKKRYFIAFKTLIQVVPLGITLTNETYNIDIIQRRFWLAAMRAPYVDGARDNPWEKMSKDWEILEKINERSNERVTK